jgi:ComF family protein
MKGAWSTVSAHVRGVAGALASVIFPAPCRVCGRILENASRIPICLTCLASLLPYAGPMCGRCGRPLVSQVTVETESPPLCHVCRRGLYDFDFARSYGIYSRTMARAIILLKYHRVFPLGGWFAARLQGIALQYPEMFAADVVVPVPVHAVRLRERGYNQAELIARPLARLLGLPFRSYLLVRTRPRPDKLILTLRERWRTVRGAYAIRQRTRVDNLRVLLIDDVMTTGATLDACSRALRGAGASAVTALVAARAVPQAQVAGAGPSPEVLEE